MGKMIYTIKAEYHDVESLTKILSQHPEIQFISLMGVDIGGNGTDEKIPVRLFIKDMEEMLRYGIQTDGSSVELQGIADLSDARVDLLPDAECTWFVDYNYEYDGYICVNSTGNLLQPDYITETFAKLLKKHKLKKIRFHDLRHSCATLLLNLGFSMKEIQVWLGHSDFQITAKTYAHVDYKNKIVMIDRVSNMLCG